jgi:hypothetical protein
VTESAAVRLTTAALATHSTTGFGGLSEFADAPRASALPMTLEQRRDVRLRALISERYGHIAAALRAHLLAEA